VKTRIQLLSFLLLALIFSCKSNAQRATQNNDQSDIPPFIPQAETQIIQSQEPVKIAELTDTTDTAEEMPLSSDIDEEDNIPEATNEEDREEVLEEPLEEIEQPESIEIVEGEEIPEIPEIEETPIQEETQEPEEQEPNVEMVEESVPLPAEEPPPVEPPPVQLPPPPPVQQPPVQQPPVPPPVQQQPPTPSQVPERTVPRPPPSPPPFLGPAESEITPPRRQEPIAPAIPELPSLPRDEKPEEQVVFSRIVRLTVGQMLEIPFRGTGWVYLGELGNRRGLSYDSRRLDTQGGNTLGQSFIFRAETAGTYILKFYRQDFIQDYIINDYVQVIVSEADDSGRGRPFSSIDRGRVIAEPRWPIVPEVTGSTSETVSPTTTPTAGSSAATNAGSTAGAASGTQRSDATQVVEPASPAVSGSSPATPTPSQSAASPSIEVVTPDEYVRQAKQEFDAGHVEQALDILERMKQRYPSGTDEAWWLLGQLYESNSTVRDIKQSLEYYRRLINEYPQSNRVDDARRRIAYLERYYLNIR
jgi:hypothetical protein